MLINKKTLLTIAMLMTAAATTLARPVPKHSILSIKETITDSAIVYPASFETDTREMMNNWYLQNYAILDKDVEKRSAGDVSDAEYVRRLKAIPSVIELPFNQIVRSYIERYIKRNRTLVEQMLGMSLYYMPIFEQALEKEGLPLELKYVPVIESALNPNAVSPVGASGLWQFMIGTAKGVGLEVNSLVDERRDPYRSSEKAAVYFKQLHDIYGDWSLAIAAYNCGPANVNKAIRRAGVESNPDFWTIYNYLPRETRGYVPAFIAANYIMTYFKEHNISPSLAKKPIVVDTVSVSHRINFNQISKVLNIPLEEIRVLNPQYRHDVIPGDARPYTLALPSQQIYSFILTEDSIASYRPDLYAQREVVEPGGASHSVAAEQAQPSQQQQTVYHKVQRGESLAGIAFYYGVSTDEIRALNGISGTRVRRGQVLKIVKKSTDGSSLPGDALTAQEAAAQPDGDATVSVVEQENKSAAASKQVPARATASKPAYKGSYSIDDEIVTSSNSRQVPQPRRQQPQAQPQVPQSKAKAADRATAQSAKAPKATKKAKADDDDDAAATARYGKGKTRYGKAAASAGKSRESTYKTARSSRDTKSRGKKQKKHVAAPQQAAQDYTIQKGDNLITIAKKTGVSVDELRKANKLKGDKIDAGDKMTIPGKAKAGKASKGRKRAKVSSAKGGKKKRR